MSRCPHTAFDTVHPAVCAVYLAVTLGLTMFSMEPVLIACALAGALAYLCCARGPRACLDGLRWQVPLVALVALVNPLFASTGTTPLFSMMGRVVYLESVAYGCAFGVLLVATTLWFSAADTLLPFDELFGLLGNAAPALSLMLSMTLRLIPRMVKRGREIASVQDVALSCLGARETGTSVPSRRLRQTSVLMGWSMEDSLKTADAMRARGWMRGMRRTAYQRRHMTAVDAFALIALGFGAVLCAWLAVVATTRFSFYPTLGVIELWWGYAPYALWMFVPALLHIYEERRFR